MTHLVLRSGGHAVEDDRDDGTSVDGRAQQVPWHGVGVSGRRRHEQPQVRGGEELGRELSVLADHGVDVGGVEQRQTLRDRLVGHQVQSARSGKVLGGDPGEIGKDPVAGEPLGVAGVEDENGGSGRGP